MSEIDARVCSAFRRALSTAANEDSTPLDRQIMLGRRWQAICEDAEHFLCASYANDDEEE